MATKCLTLSALFYALSSLFLSGAEARATDKERITHHAASPTHDTCAFVESSFSQFLGLVSGTNSSCLSGDDTTVQACLCTSKVKAFIEFSGLEIGDMNSTEVEWAAKAYITNSPGAQKCSYPPNSTPKCSRDDPCGYECSNGFERRFFTLWGETKSACTCPLPNIVCGGLCGSFPDGCPASNVNPEGACREASGTSPSAAFVSSAAILADDSTYSAQAQQAQDAGCAPQETLCGAYAPRGRIKAECVDTRTALESCGGCMVPPPSPFDAYDDENQSRKRNMASGVDCTAIEAAADVICSSGRCLVRACETGWMVAPSGDHCVQDDFSNVIPSASDSPTSSTSDAETSIGTPTPNPTSSDFVTPDSTSPSQISPSSDPASPTPESGKSAVAATDADNAQTGEVSAASKSDSDPGAGEGAPGPTTTEDQGGDNGTAGLFSVNGNMAACWNQRRDVGVDATACVSVAVAMGTGTPTIVSASAQVDGSVSNTQATATEPASAFISDATGISPALSGVEGALAGITGGNDNTPCGLRRRDSGVGADVCVSASVGGSDAIAVTSALENPNGLPSGTALPSLTALVSVGASEGVTENGVATLTADPTTTSVTETIVVSLPL